MRARRHGGAAQPHIGQVQLGQTPRVVLAVSEDRRALASAAKHGVDIFELRVDLMPRHGAREVVETAKQLKRHGLPIIGTVRSPSEGGAAKQLTAARRLALYKAISPWVDAIDVELQSGDILQDCVRVARANRNTLIISFHDFSATPPTQDLNRIVSAATKQGADIIKIAARARNREDVARLFRFTDDHRLNHIVTIAMGPVGSISRLAFPLAGSLLTYTNVVPCDGQIPLDVLTDHLRRYYPADNDGSV